MFLKKKLFIVYIFKKMSKYNKMEEWNTFNIISNYYFVSDLFDEIRYNIQCMDCAFVMKYIRKYPVEMHKNASMFILQKHSTLNIYSLIV